MIKLIIGGVGTGKSISVIKEILDRNRKCFVNFNIKFDKAERLKIEHIAHEVVKGYDSRGKPQMKMEVNWEYWENLKKNGEEFDLYIDEAHNVANSRRSMSTWNKNFNDFLAQIRKILGSSEKSNLYIITQRLNGVDVSIRQLCHEVIYMNKIQLKYNIDSPVIENGRRKIKNLPVTIIFKNHFLGDNCVENFIMFKESKIKSYSYRTYFLANKYYDKYESFELINFGNGVYV